MVRVETYIMTWGKKCHHSESKKWEGGGERGVVVWGRQAKAVYVG